MKRVWIVLFLIIIISFSIIGYTHSTDTKNDAVEEEKDTTLIVN